jgi:uncharacterized protein YutE (UPF0331/DUF86 family)
MVSTEVVLARLKALNEYLALLDAKRHLSLAELTADLDTYHATLHRLQLASQAAIDIASHILAADFSRQADRYHDVIITLGYEGVLPLDFAQRFASITGFRNVLIHEYLTVDPNRVYAALQTGLDDVRAFAGYITDYLKKTGAQ